MSHSTILFSIDEGVARLTLNRPERLNAINKAMHEEIARALEKIESAPDVRVLVLTGAGRAFCTGQDLAERRRAPEDPPFDLGESIGELYNPLVRRLTSLPFPVICAVNGVAAGAGANLALAGDIVIAAASARFIQTFSNIGLMPDCGGTWILPRLIGQARALGFALTGDPISAQKAVDLGMIWRATPDSDLAGEVEALAAKFAAAPTRALAAIKYAIRAGSTNTLPDQLDLERDLQRELGFSSDYAEGVAAFMEKRAPQFKGR